MRFYLFCIISFLTYTCFILSIYLDSFSEVATNADFAIVFGNKVHINAKPSNRLVARLDASLSLYKKRVIKSILVSGGVGREGHDEAKVMANYLISKGVPIADIIVDSAGSTTSLTALNAAKLIGTNMTVIAVSQQYHISRAKLSLKNAGFTKVYGNYPDFTEIRDIYSFIREVPAWGSYWLLRK